MFLAADIGNTNIVVGIHDGNEWIQKVRYETKGDRPYFFYEAGLRDILLEWGVNPSEIKAAGLSSVVPHLNDQISEAIAHNTGFKPLVLGPEVFMKMDIEIPKVYEIGSDLVADAYAALQYSEQAIVVDFGTALTFTVVNAKKGILGVTFTPGLRTSISNLSGNTAMLPEVDLIKPKTIIGRSTSHAIRAGILYGYVGLVKEILRKIHEELDEPYKVIATGGLSSVLPELEPHFYKVEKNLTLEGIRLITQKFG